MRRSRPGSPRSAQVSSDRCDQCHRLNVLYSPFSETTPTSAAGFPRFSSGWRVKGRNPGWRGPQPGTGEDTGRDGEGRSPGP
ncbi:hypothetical protein FG147_02610 [Thauera sp. UPWRP]|nr:hypothetical protein FG147_02610 [Thauera sp. UPWRP]